MRGGPERTGIGAGHGAAGARDLGRRAILAMLGAGLVLASATPGAAQGKGASPPGGSDFGSPPSTGTKPPTPAPGPASSGGGDDRMRLYNAPPDRVWTVARSTLLSLGWKVDKEDREVGWLITKSRGVNGEDYGVYAKGTKHRLRVVVKGREAGRTEVSVERRVWKEERILFVDKEEEIPTSDRTVERRVLDAIGKNL